jgi:hypothetical protein
MLGQRFSDAHHLLDELRIKIELLALGHDDPAVCQCSGHQFIKFCGEQSFGFAYRVGGVGDDDIKFAIALLQIFGMDQNPG